MNAAVALHRENLVLGRYRPLRPLGSGGSGSVWLARDEAAQRNVALKVVPREGKAGARAEREVAAGARLRHPRCLRALAIDRDDGHVYVIYPYVAGTTLRDALRSGGLRDSAAVEAAAQVLEALAHAHSKGVVHRDVKPANIMLESAQDVSVRVLDFGLAQLAEAETLTAAGDVPGTLGYIAPERLDGKDASGAADVWSVGVILWEALAGRHPFWAASPLETARKIREGAGPLRSQRPDLPRALCATVDRMLALEPARRPPAGRLAAILRTATAERRERREQARAPANLVAGAAHATLAGLFTAGATLALPFFPTGWPFALGVAAAMAAFFRPRAGLALAVTAPLLPLGNVSLGLALLYAAFALAWFITFAGDARSGLLFCLGPLLAPLGALALLPALVHPAAGLARRAALAGAGVAAAAATAAFLGWPPPLTEDAAGAALRLGATESPVDAGLELGAFVSAQPPLALEILVFAAAAAATGTACRFGAWGVAAWGSCFLAAVLLAPGATVAALPLTLAVWGAAGLLLVAVLRRR